MKYITLFLLLFTISSYGQNITEIKFKTGEKGLYDFIQQKFLQERFKYSGKTICANSAFFVKFTVDAKGNVDHISFSKNDSIPAYLKDIAAATIMATSGRWIPRMVDGKPAESRPFILPVFFDEEDNCRGDDYKDYPIWMLRDFLKYDDSKGGQILQLDCIILAPLQVFSAT